MKKTLLALFLVLLMSTPVFADIVNGGFEDGLTGWTTSASGQVSITNVGTDVRTNGALSTVGNGSHSVMVGDPYAPLVDGNYNDPFSVSQTWAKSDTFSDLYFNWAAVALVPGTNAAQHTVAQTPWFQIQVLNVTDGSTLFSQEYFSGSVDTGIVAGWLPGSTVSSGYSNDPGDWYYRPWEEFHLALNTVDNGDQLKVILSTRDCTLGGHASYAYLDGFGKTPDPVSTPEPATLIFLGLGLVGLTAAKRKFKN